MGLKSRLTVLAAGLVLVAAITPSALASTPSHSTSTTTTVPASGIAVQNGGTVNVAVPYLPSEFNPSTPSGENAVTAMVMQQVWPQPFVVNGQLQASPSLDSHSQPSLLGPAGAELVSVHPETVVYNVNPAARWSDGVPISIADFVYNWQQQLAEGPLLPATDPYLGYEDIKSVTGSNGGRTVTVVFSKPYADWEALFANLVPAHVGLRYGWAKAFAGFNPAREVSGGPFAITRFVPGKELVLSRNRNYWGDPPDLDHIIFRVEPNASATIAGLEHGQVGVALLAPSAAVSDLGGQGKFTLQPSLSPTLWQVVFNLANPSTEPIEVRRAIASAIDRDQLIANTVGFLTPFNQTSGNRVYASGAPGSQGDDGPYSQVDVAEADQLLSSAGDVLEPDGHLYQPNGAPVGFDLVGPSGSTMVDELEAQLSAELLQAGIELHVHNEPPGELLGSTLPKGNYELALAPFGVSPFPSTSERLYSDPVGPTPNGASFPSLGATTTTLGSTGSLGVVPPIVPTHVAGNEVDPDATVFGAVTRDVFGYDDPSVSALYGEAESALNASSASALYNEVDSLLWQDMPTLPLFQMPVVLVTRSSLLNVNDTQTLAGPLWDAQDWAIELNPPTTTTTSP